MELITETPRLLLRKITLDDAQSLFDLNADPEVIKYVGDSALKDIDEAKAIINDRILFQYTTYGFGRWAMIEKETGSFVGWCGLKFLSDLNEVDVGYRLFRKHWGKGFATESALASLKYGFETKNLERIIGRAMSGNIASIKVLEKCGMKYCRDDFEHDGVAKVYEIFNQGH
jgi:[ribosomal protein S5]-alanine N-acetyltransferase